MKTVLLVGVMILSVLYGANADPSCNVLMEKGCGDMTQTGEPKTFPDVAASCDPIFSGFEANMEMLQKYANAQIQKSYDYLLLTAQFSTYTKNRPGLEKLYHSMSDEAWDDGIKLIEYITQRGGSMDFNAKYQAVAYDKNNRTALPVDMATNEVRVTFANDLVRALNTDNMNEHKSLSYALDVEKQLANEASHIHQHAAHARETRKYDPAVQHFIEEEFLEKQAKVIRKLTGYIVDISKLTLQPSGTKKVNSLGIYLFDEYLAKQ